MNVKISAVCLSALLLLVILAGCANQPARLPNGAAENDILTFYPNTQNRPIIRIGMQYYPPNDGLIETLQAAFPDYLFVIDNSACAGTGAEKAIFRNLEAGTPFDIVIAGKIAEVQNGKKEWFVDLSAETFLNDYLLSALNRVSVDGHIYSIPATSTLSGIAFNADMFAEHGWEIPSDTDGFFALCEEIRASGIVPFSACFKYSVAVNRLLTMMCYSELYKAPDDAAWLNGLLRGEATYAGHMEPLYALAKRFADTGVIPLSYFTASLTKQRQSFWAGEVAMIDYESTIYAYAETENAPFEIGMMPYPAMDGEDSGFGVNPEYYFYIPKLVEKDPERLAFVKEILAFISSPEGQNTMLVDNLRVSNVKGLTHSDVPAMRYAQEAYEKGNLYPIISYEASIAPIQDLQQASVLALFEGASVEEGIAMMDESLERAFAEGVPVEEYEVLAEVEENFSVLETSYYVADQLRAATGADIGLMVNGGYFRSNLATMNKGQITSDLTRFVMKGMGAEDYLTTYRLTGARLRELLEHPIINGAEIDVLIAASGCGMEYAPWNERGARVLKLTLADGSTIMDDALYTVAAFPGVIDERYEPEIVEVFDSLGTITDIMKAGLKRDAKIRPDIAGRLKLVWPDAGR